MPKEVKLVRSSGNVFSDIGFAAAESTALLQRAQLMAEVIKRLRAQSKTQQELGAMLGIGQSRVSDLMQGKAHLFSLEMLISFAGRLGMSVTVEVQAEKPVPAPVAAERVPRPTATTPGWIYPRKTAQQASVTSATYGRILFDRKESVARPEAGITSAFTPSSSSSTLHWRRGSMDDSAGGILRRTAD